MSVTISEPEAEQPIRGGGLTLTYIATWGVIGFASALYVGIVNSTPEIVGLPPHGQAIEQIARMGPNRPAPDDNEPLASARMEIARLKTELSLREEQIRAEARNTAARRLPPAASTEPAGELQQERRIAEATIINAPQAPAAVETGSLSAPVAAEAPTPAVEAKEPAARAPEPSKLPVAATEPAKAMKPSLPEKVAASPAQGPVVAFGAPVVKPAKAAAPPTANAPAALGISLARAQSVEQLRSTWALLRSRNGDALAGLTPRYQVTASDPQLGPTYSLIAGPLKTADDVARACSAAIASGLTCATVTYGGNAL